MNCQSCGNTLPESAALCPHCGAPQANPQQVEPEATYEVPTTAGSQQDYQPVAVPHQPAAADAVQGAPQQPASSSVAQDYQQAAPQSAFGAQPASADDAQAASATYEQTIYGGPVQQVSYAKGCVSTAWEDLKGNKGWAKKTALLGLIQCVPILNFMVSGYAFSWAREIPFGQKSSMPNKILTGPHFEKGFYLFLIALVVSLVLGLGSSVLAFIPLLGWVAAVVLSLAGSMFTALCQFRMIIMQQLGEGFQVMKAWEAMKRNWADLLIAVMGPWLVAFAACAVLSIVAAVVVGMGAAVFAFVASSGFGLLVVLFALLGVLVFAVLYVMACMFDAAAILVSARAVGHWVARYAPEWAVEASQVRR